MAGLGSMYSSGWKTPWKGMSGYTDFGSLSPEVQRYLQTYGTPQAGDVVWGNNKLKGFLRKSTGRAPYAVKNTYIDDVTKLAKNANAANAGTTAAGATATNAANTAGATVKAGATKAANGVKGLFAKAKASPIGRGMAKLGTVANTALNIAPFAIQGYQAVKGLDDYADTTDDLEDMLASIGNLTNSNPLAYEYLTADELSQLRRLERQDYDASEFELEDAFSDPASLLKGAGSGAMWGLPFLFTGNPIPLLLSTLLGAGVSGIENAKATREEEMQDLEGLYNSLQNASRDYQTIKRPPIQGLGIQQRFQNMYM